MKKRTTHYFASGLKFGCSIAAFIETLDVAEAVKEELRALSPSTYTGIFR